MYGDYVWIWMSYSVLQHMCCYVCVHILYCFHLHYPSLPFPFPFSLFIFFLFSFSHPCPVIHFGLDIQSFPIHSAFTPLPCFFLLFLLHTLIAAPSLVCQHCFPLLERVFHLYTTLGYTTHTHTHISTCFSYTPCVCHRTSHTLSTDWLGPHVFERQSVDKSTRQKSQSKSLIIKQKRRGKVLSGLSPPYRGTDRHTRRLTYRRTLGYMDKQQGWKEMKKKSIEQTEKDERKGRAGTRKP